MYQNRKNVTYERNLVGLLGTDHPGQLIAARLSSDVNPGQEAKTLSLLTWE